MKFRYVLFFLLLGFLFEACSASKIANREPDDRGYLVRVGDKAPEFSFEYLDGSMANLKDFRGQVVMLQFTASWCGVCIKEMPHIEEEVWQTYKDQVKKQSC